MSVYDRQETVRLAVPSTVHIVGCGGVGSWVALYLALAGVEQLHLYDPDTVEESNLNRLPYPPSACGKLKTKVLGDLLLSLRPSLEIREHGAFEPLLHKFSRWECVVGAVDTMRDRQRIAEAAQDAGESVHYIDVGAEATECTVSDSPADWSIAADRPGYFTPIWVGPVTLAASIVAGIICTGGFRVPDPLIHAKLEYGSLTVSSYSKGVEIPQEEDEDEPEE